LTSQIALRRHLTRLGVLLIRQAKSGTAGHTERMTDNRELGYVLADNREGRTLLLVERTATVTGRAVDKIL